MQDVVGSFKDSSTPKKVQVNGLHIAGQKYLTLNADDNHIYAKQVWVTVREERNTANTGEQGKTGIIIVKTKQALLVTHYPETVQPGTATNTVEKLGDYLIGVGY